MKEQFKVGDLVYFVTAEYDGETREHGIGNVRDIDRDWINVSFSIQYLDYTPVSLSDQTYPDDFICHAVPLIKSLFGEDL